MKNSGVCAIGWSRQALHCRTPTSTAQLKPALCRMWSPCLPGGNVNRTRADVIVGSNAPVVDALAEKTGLPIEVHCMIGDRLYTDIAGAVGMMTALVLSGETNPIWQVLNSTDLIVRDIAEMLDVMIGLIHNFEQASMGSTIEKLTHILTPLKLGAWQYYSTLESTNDLALAWLQQGTSDWSLILADEQTAGRGRNLRPWLTRPGSGLAMSLAFRLNPVEQSHVPRFTALAALSLVKVLVSHGLEAE